MSDRLRGAWPALLTFALLFGGAIGLSLVQGRYGRPEPAPDAPPPASGEAAIAGWRGPSDLAFAGLTLRLTPLHAEPARQAFDAAALAARLGLATDGQPWRLEVSWEPVDADEPGPWPALEAAIAAGTLRLVDEAGDCAGPLVGAAADRGPLLALFDTARTFDTAAASGQVHLWGRQPGARPRLVAEGLDLVLVPADFGRDEVATFVARAEGSAGGSGVGR